MQDTCLHREPARARGLGLHRPIQSPDRSIQSHHPMVLPIAIGVGVTIAALTGKAVVRAVHRFNRLSPQMIAALNQIRLDTTNPDSHLATLELRASHLRYLKSRFNATGFPEKMTEREALLVMGIEAADISSLTRDSLKQRYRKLMVMNHPDRSGSVYLCQKINQAKDVLDQSYLLKK